MLRGFYGAASGMLAQQRQTQMLSENLSNLNTPGFKADQGSNRTFPEMLVQAQNAENFPGSRPAPIGELATGVYMQERTPDFSQGNLRETGNTADAAIWQQEMPEGEDGEQGSLFFRVSNADGEERYTRNGNWTVDGEGFLTTSQGNYVLGQDDEPIQVGNENFSIDKNGVITDDAGAEAGQLGVAYADNANNLVKEGNGLFRLETEDGAEALPTAIGADGVGYTINQGSLERSNVDPGETMTELMNSYRIFESNQRMLRTYDQSMQRAANEIGSLR
ncbi:flagellar hook-basal body protein [Salibacterium halotolerans]|uniref:Flagellar basal-body rod protein FlgG n=1 Tax=Salibacterium halotolerans TaxID=1884432 RepID=A0A1I5X5W2_9BACI|nr:flagellar hook-basal body protein [Salibacterium halotolerans]SFQ27362.1 flagellar basal-body rod protein FlgG [Salibacterium halotolerans]